MIKMNPLQNTALGSVIGAFVGDSLGSFIEFQRDISHEDLANTFQMRGGGPFNVGSGQVTDDSELAMCILRGLLDVSSKLDLNAIAHYYKNWVRTAFDIGITTRNALYPLTKDNPARAERAIVNARTKNQNSLSNGSVMRCTPLALFCHKLPDVSILSAVTAEASMTHSNPLISQIESCYVKAITHLINNTGDYTGAYDSTRRFASEFCSADCTQWLDDVENAPPMPGHPKEGFVKIAFDHAFRHLRRGSDFRTAMRETLLLGGDTDTNAAIVGGMAGAVVGFDAIPNEWAQKVMTFHSTVRRGIPRPEFLDQREVYQQCLRLLEIAPTQLVIEGNY